MSLKQMIALVSFLTLSIVAQGTLFSIVNAAEDEVANINGASISSDEFQKRMERLTREGQGNFDTPEGKEELLDILISREVLSQEGKRLGLDKKKEVKERIEELTKEVMISEVVNQIAAEKLTDAEMKKYYNKNKAEFKEVRASHILVKTEEEAKEIKKKLDQGGDFAALAKEKSTDPGSAPRGGDLGFFTKDRMVKAFSDAAFSLKVNEISKPVQSPFGFHIIKVVETKDAKNFEELAPAQLQNIRGTMINDEIDQLKEKAKIKINKNRLMQISSVPAPDHSMDGPGEHSMSAPPSQK
ncbi:MAG: peptidylprolyl isomerase [Candidatus Manganitrophus sp.]|nr:peptidylprolyl isomerase [Candidatus Manganitrophus sp.]